MHKKNPAEENTRYEVITQEDPDTGDMLIPIPQPLLDKLGWKEGDDVNIGIDEMGRLFLRKS